MQETEPLPYVVNSLLGIHRILEHPGVGHRPHKARCNDPWDADALCAADKALSPEAGVFMQRRQVTVSVDQKARVRITPP